MIPARSITFCFARSLVYGGALKYTASILVMYICGLNFTISGFIDPYFLTAATSLLFISMYNGERGMKMKYFFYIFYPGHLFIFYLVSLIL